MALNITKSTTLKGQSKIGEEIAVTMSASITEDGKSSSVKNIINQELYEENKVECRADEDAFTEAVRAIEDAE